MSLFKPTADLFTIPQEGQDDAQTNSVSEIHSAGAKRGFKAEKLLIERINERSPATVWVVEQAVRQVGYGDVMARKPGPRDKPDVILLQQEVVRAGISLKTFGPGTSSSNQVFRTPVDQYEREWDVPRDVAALIRNFVGIGESLSRVFLMKSTRLRLRQSRIFGQVQPHVVSSILAGKAGAALRADWMMLHEAADDKWHERVGNREFWKMYPMARLLTCAAPVLSCNYYHWRTSSWSGSNHPEKRGDGGGPGANDLQFKMSPRAILVALGNAG